MSKSAIIAVLFWISKMFHLKTIGFVFNQRLNQPVSTLWRSFEKRILGYYPRTATLKELWFQNLHNRKTIFWTIKSSCFHKYQLHFFQQGLWQSLIWQRLVGKPIAECSSLLGVYCAKSGKKWII